MAAQFSGVGGDGEQQCGEDDYYGDDHQQFDHGEGAGAGTWGWAHVRLGSGAGTTDFADFAGHERLAADRGHWIGGQSLQPPTNPFAP